MYIRCLVAVKDFNANVGRPDKKVDGKTLYKMKVCTRHTVLDEMLDLFGKIKTIFEKQYITSPFLNNLAQILVGMDLYVWLVITSRYSKIIQPFL